MLKFSLILFGGNRLLENAPMSTLVKFLKKKKIKFILITDPEHLKKKISENQSFKNFLQQENINYKSFKKLKTINIKKFIKKNTIGLSLNSIWKFRKDIINKFNGNFYNYHAADLPTERGAGTISWRLLLNKKNNFSLNIHKIDEDFDTGTVVLKKKITKDHTSSSLPFEILKKQRKIEKPFLEKFINMIIANKIKKFKNLPQNNNKSYYWPRLNSDIDGKINWNWDAEDIIKFIKAFSCPFKGSFSYINNRKIKILDAKRFKSEIIFHPFQNGLIFRKDKMFIYIACGRYFIRIKHKDIIFRKKNFNMLGKRIQ
jgi:methionyl-tRNA formyltransferase